jgi:ATP synthase, F1 delta subunit
MAEVISKAYADILFESASNKSTIDILYSQVENIVNSDFTNKLFKTCVHNSTITENEKFLEFKEYFAGALNKDLIRFIGIVISYGNYKDLPYIFKYFLDNVKEHRKIAVATIFSAKELSETEKTEISNVILEKTKYTFVEAKYFLDKSLIEGVQIRLRGEVLDMSAKAKIYDYSMGHSK